MAWLRSVAESVVDAEVAMCSQLMSLMLVDDGSIGCRGLWCGSDDRASGRCRCVLGQLLVVADVVYEGPRDDQFHWE